MTNEFSHSVRLAVKASQTTVDSHALIYWPEEECVSITEMTRIIEGKLAEGEQCRVRVGRRVYIGIIVRLGESAIFYTFSLVLSNNNLRGLTNNNKERFVLTIRCFVIVWYTSQVWYITYILQSLPQALNPTWKWLKSFFWRDSLMFQSPTRIRIYLVYHQQNQNNTQHPHCHVHTLYKHHHTQHPHHFTLQRHQHKQHTPTHLLSTRHHMQCLFHYHHIQQTQKTRYLTHPHHHTSSQPQAPHPSIHQQGIQESVHHCRTSLPVPTTQIKVVSKKRRKRPMKLHKNQRERFLTLHYLIQRRRT